MVLPIGVKAPNQWWYHGDYYYHPWNYSLMPKENDYYEPHNNVINRFDVKISLGNNICPHCGSNHCSLQREGYDLYCFICGWRDSHFFNDRLNRFIKWVENRETKYGSPELIDDNTKYLRARDKIYKDKNREASREYNRNWAYQNKDKMLDYKKRYNENNREKLKMEARFRRANMSKEKREEYLEKQRVYNKTRRVR